MALRSENDVLHLLHTHFTQHSPHLVLGMGDDCAELLCPSRMALSTDIIVENIHFRTSYFTPEDIGYKALAVNLSDLAAAGAVPLGFSLTLMLPTWVDSDFIEGVFSGMADLAHKHTIVLVGGDISRAAQLALNITVWGKPVPEMSTHEQPFLRRSPVQVGDTLFLVGPVGLARTGLQVLEGMAPEVATRVWPAACAAHKRPTPLIEAGKALAALQASIHAPIQCMDVSDGLAQELPRMLGTLGAEITIDASILHHETRSYATIEKLHPVDIALAGGEDFALLGCCASEHIEQVCAVLPQAQVLGQVTESGTILCNGVSIAQKGFDHFQHAGLKR